MVVVEHTHPFQEVCLYLADVKFLLVNLPQVFFINCEPDRTFTVVTLWSLLIDYLGYRQYVQFIGLNPIEQCKTVLKTATNNDGVAFSTVQVTSLLGICSVFNLLYKEVMMMILMLLMMVMIMMVKLLLIVMTMMTTTTTMTTTMTMTMMMMKIR